MKYVVDPFGDLAIDVGFGTGIRRGRQPDPHSLGRGVGGFGR